MTNGEDVAVIWFIVSLPMNSTSLCKQKQTKTSFYHQSELKWSYCRFLPKIKMNSQFFHASNWDIKTLEQASSSANIKNQP